MVASVDELRARLAPYGQQHVLRFWDRLDEGSRQQLGGQIESLDMDQLQELIEGKDVTTDFGALAKAADPPWAVTADGSGTSWTVEQARAAGEEALRAGRLGMILVAGGQGTRLGFDSPKGMFPIGPLSNRTLFQMHADRLQAVARRYGVRIPLYLMTSPLTHEPTLEYLEANGWLGFDREDLVVFCQGTMPAVDAERGRLLLAEQDSLALSPDGHGGVVAALEKSGILRQSAARGIDQFFYAQVDNPLVEVCDPTFIGHHLMAESEMTTQVIRKRFATEKVGNVVSVDGRLQIIEYSDLPEDVANQREDSGELRLWAGSIAVHVIGRRFLDRVVSKPQLLPFHRANKKVPFVDEKGERVEPQEPNGIKFERFIFDLLPAAENAIVIEGLPEQVFAPVKNADGAPTDTPQACRQALVAQHRRWIEAAGSKVAEGVAVEIHPDVALDQDEARRVLKNLDVTEDRYFAPGQ